MIFIISKSSLKNLPSLYLKNYYSHADWKNRDRRSWEKPVAEFSGPNILRMFMLRCQFLRIYCSFQISNILKLLKDSCSREKWCQNWVFDCLMLVKRLTLNYFSDELSGSHTAFPTLLTKQSSLVALTISFVKIFKVKKDEKLI